MSPHIDCAEPLKFCTMNEVVNYLSDVAFEPSLVACFCLCAQQPKPASKAADGFYFTTPFYGHVQWMWWAETKQKALSSTTHAEDNTMPSQPRTRVREQLDCSFTPVRQVPVEWLARKDPTRQIHEYKIELMNGWMVDGTSHNFQPTPPQIY